MGMGMQIGKRARAGAAISILACFVFATVAGAQSGSGFAPQESDLPAAGVKASVLIYTAGRGRSQADMILSWK